MSDLYPTPSRVALLQSIDDGAVSEKYPMGPKPAWSELDNGPGGSPRYVKVTAKVAEMKRAGWVELGSRSHPSMYAPRPWLLTDLGRSILDGAK